MKAYLFLCPHSRNIAVETTSVYVDGFAARLLPVFDHIDEEAATETEKAWQAASSSPACNENVDPSVYAEAVQEYGLEVYKNLQFTRQQLLGLATAGLYHLWERLLKQFLCKELRGWTFNGCYSRKMIADADFGRLESFLSQFGFQLKKQLYYADVCELRHVANVVKHGDGKSCEELRALAPRLFEGLDHYFDIFSNRTAWS